MKKYTQEQYDEQITRYTTLCGGALLCTIAFLVINIFAGFQGLQLKFLWTSVVFFIFFYVNIIGLQSLKITAKMEEERGKR